MRQATPRLVGSWWVIQPVVQGNRIRVKLAPRTEDKDQGQKQAQDMLAKWEAKQQAEKVATTPHEASVQNMTVRAAVACFLELQSANKPGSMVKGKLVPHNTVIHYRDKLRKLASFTDKGACLGDKPLSKVTSQDAVAFKKCLQTEGWKRLIRNGDGVKEERFPYSAVQVNHFIRASKTFFNYCKDEGWIQVNPFAKLELESEQGRTRTYTNDEFRSLLRHANPDFRRLLVMLRNTAFRPGEYRKLQWKWVDLAQHCIVIPWTEHKTGKKTKQDRMIPLNHCAEKLLLWLRAKGISKTLVFPNPKTDDQWEDNSLSQHFRRLRDRAGIKDKDGEKLVLYSARHTRLTELGSKINPSVLQSVAGHTTFKMTQRYIHHQPTTLVNAVREADAKP